MTYTKYNIKYLKGRILYFNLNKIMDKQKLIELKQKELTNLINQKSLLQQNIDYVNQQIFEMSGRIKQLQELIKEEDSEVKKK